MIGIDLLKRQITVPLGPCILCREPVTAEVPSDESFTFEKPLICDKCRKGLLKLIRPDLEPKKKYEVDNLANTRQ